MNSARKIRILVVDDHPAFRLGLVAMVNSAPDMEVVAEAGGAGEAIAQFSEHLPDISLIDLRLGEVSGVELIIALRRKAPDCRLIVITTYDADEDIYRALQSGAKSYLLKGMTVDELQTTIRAVYQGETPLPAQVAQRLASRLARPELTQRELDILQSIVRGLSNKEIAAEHHIAEVTVKSHLKHLFAKLRVNDRTQAAICAVQHGIVHIW
jgi:DNA-binding NarL/FixJ family response regulator